MIEAVNSVLSNASLLRGNAEQAAGMRSVDLETQSSVVVLKAPYVSPYISLDLDYDKAVLQIRDSETGKIVCQYPSEKKLQQQRAILAEAEFRNRDSFVNHQDVVVSDSGSSQQVVSLSTDQQQGTDVTIGDGGNIAQAQMASAALAIGAQAGAESTSAEVSVLA
ncbi:MAG: hypothetical protein KAJ86_07720 [Alphaproteobacteria bacterium]|nr:hypothetical protein [Alphaproteobacteria bacterium]